MESDANLVLDSQKTQPSKWIWLVWPTLILLTLGVYGQTWYFDFVNYDDQLYVFENENVLGGVSRQSVEWAFTTTLTGNWIPLTWLSLILDAQLFGKDAGGFHFTNVMLHVLNALLLFAALRELTGEAIKSAVVAALFAVHPLHVESVAWISERKDVLSTFFGFISLLAYARFVRRGGKWNYIAALVAYVFSLMSKQMLVTLPCVMLLMDYWPLGRFSSVKAQWLRLLREKISFVALAVLFSGIAFYMQQTGKSVVPLDVIPMHVRVFNAVLSYAIYLRKTVWPFDLAVFYPHPRGAIQMFAVIGSALLLLLVSVVAILQARRRPYLLVGWLWYLGTLVPVIGLIQIGDQQLADRYTYIPLIGCFIAITWLAPSLVHSEKWRRAVLSTIAVGGVLGFTVTAAWQTSQWKDSVTLWKHTLSIGQGHSFQAFYNLASILNEQGRSDEAMFYFSRASEVNPNDSRPFHNMGVLFEQANQMDAAIDQYRMAVRVNPRDAKAHNSLGVALHNRGKIAQAIIHYQQTLKCDPKNAPAHTNLGVALEAMDRFDEAFEHYRSAVAIAPNDPRMHNNLGVFLIVRREDSESAIRSFREALRIDPNYTDAQVNLKAALQMLQDKN